MLGKAFRGCELRKNRGEDVILKRIKIVAQ